MFLDAIIRKPNLTELDRAYKKLNTMYQDLHEEKQTELEIKDQQLKRLTSKLRHWMRRYHELEVSTREDTVDVTDLEAQDQEYVQHLQDIVAEISKKNHRLEQRISAMKLASKPKTKKIEERCEVIEIAQSMPKAELDKKALKAEKKNRASKQEQEVELQFSPKFQALLERHAQECSA
jgi:hypothetical protein